MTSIFEQLKAPFHPDKVKSRKAFGGNKKTLHYIDARDVMERLDEVVGPAGWQSEILSDGAKTICKLHLKVDGEWLFKSDGAGDTQIEADKGAISDAFKRAAVLWGIGRYLYEGRDPKIVWKEHTGQETKGGNPDLGVEDLLSKLQECKDDDDLNSFRKEYGKTAKSLDGGDKIIEEFKKLKTKFKEL